MLNIDRYKMLNDLIGVLKKHPSNDLNRSHENNALCGLVAELATRVNRKFITSKSCSEGLVSINIKSKMFDN